MARLEDSGNRIINCTFQKVAFDLVLHDADDHANLEDAAKLKNADKNDRAKLQSFIRAMKYWSKRCGIAIKSCAIEQAVVDMWPDTPKSSEAFKFFLHRVEDAVKRGCYKDKLTPESIKELGSKARDALKDLEL